LILDQSKEPSKWPAKRRPLGVQLHHLLQSEIPPEQGKTMWKEQIGMQESWIRNDPADESQAKKRSMNKGKEAGN
jgi:hypothetical protein